MARPLFLFLFLLPSFSSTTTVETSAVSNLPAADDSDQLHFPNPHLRRAYIALQTWKTTAIFSDPKNVTSSWVGPNVCSYTGIYCAPLPSHPSLIVVASVDLNTADIAGYLPPELALLSDLAIFHLNSNRFCGVLPPTLRRLRLLRELDLSNNRFAGEFPYVVLSLPSLRYLDLCFNEFEGPIPSALFRLPLDAIFLNSNRFRSGIPEALGDSPASVVVLANNGLGGCIPSSIGKMKKTLNEIVLLNNDLTGCIPPEVGKLRKVTVFDVSFNPLQGSIPASFAGLASIEQLDIGRNRLTGFVPGFVCRLTRLQNFTFSHNFFTGEAAECGARERGVVRDGRENCIAGLPNQRPPGQCTVSDTSVFDCSEAKCGGGKQITPQSPGKPKPRNGRRIPPSPPTPVGGTHRGFTPKLPPQPPVSESPPPIIHHPPPAYQSPSPAIRPGYHYQPPPEHPSHHSPLPAEHSKPAPPISEHLSQPQPPQELSPPPLECGGGNLTLPPVVGVSYASPPPPSIPYY